MKVSRFKKSQKYLTFFVSNFNYREPYQVLIDATFCQAALKNQVNIEEQLTKYFQSRAKLLTTQCIILEAESLGAPLIGAATTVKRFYVHKCGHEGKPVSASECIKSMTKGSRYIVATQDRTIQARLRKVPGRCLLYLHKATPVLEAPSDASKRYVLKKSQDLLPKKLEKHIEHIKKIHKLPTDVTPKANEKKRKGPKNPNPLSCKKSKKHKSKSDAEHLKEISGVKAKSLAVVKSKRKRIRLPSHVKEIIKGDRIGSKGNTGNC